MSSSATLVRNWITCKGNHPHDSDHRHKLEEHRHCGHSYSAAPITAGNNSYEIWNFGHFSGTYDQISAGLFAHTSTAFGTGLTLKGCPACTTTSGSHVYHAFSNG